jgi:hypothetical protein
MLALNGVSFNICPNETKLIKSKKTESMYRIFVDLLCKIYTNYIILSYYYFISI